MYSARCSAAPLNAYAELIFCGMRRFIVNETLMRSDFVRVSFESLTRELIVGSELSCLVQR